MDFAPVEALSGGASGTHSIAGFAQTTYDLTRREWFVSVKAEL